MRFLRIETCKEKQKTIKARFPNVCFSHKNTVYLFKYGITSLMISQQSCFDKMIGYFDVDNED